MATFLHKGRDLKILPLAFLITKICKRVDMPKEDGDSLKECDVSFNPLKMKGSKEKSKKKRNTGVEGERSRAKKVRRPITLPCGPLHLLGT